MKLIKNILAVLGALFLLAGCTTKLDIKQLGDPSSYKAPAALSPSSIHLTVADVKEDKPVSFTWSVADYGQPTEIIYAILATYGGKTTTLFANLGGSSYDAKSSELYQKLTDIGIPHGKNVSLDIIISSTVGSDFSSLQSPAKTITVYTEEVPAD
jgi:hypothetical protein